MRLALAITLFALSCAIAQARLWENVGDCSTRYGEPIHVEGDARYYKRADLVIGIVFDNFHASMLMFRKEKEVSGVPEELSENEINLILEANATGQKWTERRVASVDREWILSDGTAYAIYSFAGRELTIITAQKLKALQENKANAEREKLEGF